MMAPAQHSNRPGAVKRWVVDVWADGWGGRLLLLFVAIMLFAIPAVAWMAARERAQWREFAAAHNCKKVAHVRGAVNTVSGVGVTSTGKVGVLTGTEIESDKTGWLCDDGVTYWR